MVLPLPVLWSASTYYKCSTLAMHCLTKMACACTYVRMYNAEFRLSNLNTLYVRMCNAHSLVIGWPMMMMMMIMGGGGEQWPQAPHRRPIFLARLGGQPCPLSPPGTDTT
jgi:hypothetical protein